MKAYIRFAIACLVLVASFVTTFAVVAPSADAQVPVVGSADFRNAPQLPPGQYSDRIVTGDSAWYALVYTNNTPYEFEVAVQGGSPSGVELTASFVAPTLATIAGPSTVVSGPGVEYPAGHTNVWFLKVSLASTGQDGVELPIVITIDGVQTAGVASCNDTPGCVLDDEYATLNRELGVARAALEETRQQDTLDAVETEIENLKGFAESSATLRPAAEGRLAQVEATMATLCAPDPMCDEFPDPGSKTPIVGWIVGIAALGGGAYVAMNKLRSNPEIEDPNLEPV